MRILFVFCLALSAGLAHAEPATAERCASEIGLMRGVWRSPQVFLPAYGDWELLRYVAGLGHREGVAVLPVLASEPFYFRSAHIVFLSTGFILKAANDRELTEAIRNARVEVRTRDLPDCMMMAPIAEESFPEIRLRLERQLARYQDVTVRRLRVRDPPVFQ
jgi:hypothetical protein